MGLVGCAACVSVVPVKPGHVTGHVNSMTSDGLLYLNFHEHASFYKIHYISDLLVF